jgi:large subunit ribosomal protein L5
MSPIKKSKKASEKKTSPFRLRRVYEEHVIPKLKETFGYENPMAIPKLTKVVINVGMGEAVSDSKKLTRALADLALISGQKPVSTKARQAISSFKLRAGMPIGAKVTLRGPRLYSFLDRLLTVALPRVRDFQGLKPTSFDQQGNYSFGLTEHAIFPEINADQLDQIFGFDVVVCTTAKTTEESRTLLAYLGFPFIGYQEKASEAWRI